MEGYLPHGGSKPKTTNVTGESINAVKYFEICTRLAPLQEIHTPAALHGTISGLGRAGQVRRQFIDTNGR